MDKEKGQGVIVKVRVRIRMRVRVGFPPTLVETAVGCESVTLSVCTVLEPRSFEFLKNMYLKLDMIITNALIDDFTSFKVANRSSYYDEIFKKLLSRLFLTKVAFPNNKNYLLYLQL
jgi:hypothetical protein